MWSHHTGINQSSLAPYYWPHSFQNSITDTTPTSWVTFMTYFSRTVHHDNSGRPATTCLTFLGWEPISHNAASPTVLRTSGTIYLMTSRVTWTLLQVLSRTNSKRLITLIRTHRSTFHPAPAIRPEPTDTWHVKCCILLLFTSCVTHWAAKISISVALSHCETETTDRRLMHCMVCLYTS